MKKLYRAVLAATCLIGLSSQAMALDAPHGAVILTISGNIGVTNGDDKARFDLTMLKKMGKVQIRTTTNWTKGEQVFTGVPLATLMKAVGAHANTLNARAINDYSVEIPQSDWGEGGALVAYFENGKPMSVRDKGPLWIVYPFDSKAKYRSEVTFSRSIWQLDRIVVGK